MMANMRCEWCEELVRPDHDSYDCGANMRDKWKKAAESLVRAEARLAAADRLRAVVSCVRPTGGLACREHTTWPVEFYCAPCSALRAYEAAGAPPVVT